MTIPKTKSIRETLRKQAEERNTAWTQLSVKEQLEALDRRLGKGVGAKKQRARLAQTS
jgi:hypothetical protein